MSTPPRGGMSSDEVAKVKAAMHQFMAASVTLDRSSVRYRIEWRNLLDRVARVEKSGRRRKARKWFQQLDSVAPINRAGGD